MTPGDYTGIEFVNGVTESINHVDPAQGPAPLQAPGMNWGWLFGFKFFVAEMAEVRVDGGVSGDAGALAGVGIVHAGSTACSDGSDAGGHHGGGSDAGHGGSSEAGHAADADNSVDAGTRPIVCAKPNRNHVRLSDFDVQRNFVVADIGAVFRQTDLTQEAQCHSGGAVCAPMFDSIGIHHATGEALASQATYRVE